MAKERLLLDVDSDGFNAFKVNGDAVFLSSALGFAANKITEGDTDERAIKFAALILAAMGAEAKEDGMHKRAKALTKIETQLLDSLIEDSTDDDE